MNLDLTKYRASNLKAVKAWFDRKGFADVEYGISEFAASSGVHLVAVAYFVGELYGFDNDLWDTIERLQESTHIDVVLGALERMPPRCPRSCQGCYCNAGNAPCHHCEDGHR